MPISREEFEGKDIDWRQRILFLLNSDRDLAYTEEELLALLNPQPSREVLAEALRSLVEDDLVRRAAVKSVIFYIHALPGTR